MRAVSTPATATCIPAFIDAWVIDDLLVDEQAETREFVLNALEKSGLRRTQQGEALVLTVNDVDQEMQIEEIGMLSLKAFAKLYTVCPVCYMPLCCAKRNMCFGMYRKIEPEFCNWGLDIGSRGT